MSTLDIAGNSNHERPSPAAQKLLDNRLRDQLVADVLKQIEDDVRANHPGMTDEQVKALHESAPCAACGMTSGRIKGVDVWDRGYIHAPYLPLYVMDLRPWWQGIWHWSWWRSLIRDRSLGQWWRSRRIKRYGAVPLNRNRYHNVSVRGTGTVKEDGAVEDYHLDQISLVSHPEPECRIKDH